MTLKEHDKVEIDGTEYEVTSASPTGYGFSPTGIGSSYFWFIFKTKEEIEDLFKKGRLKTGGSEKIQGGSPNCTHWNMKKYVGVREIYRYCTNCDAKEFVDWRKIKDEKDY